VVLAGNPLLLIAAVLAGVFVVVQTSKAIATHALLEYIGRNSLMIMATHFVAFKLVSLAIVHAEGLQLYRLAEFPVIGGHGEWWTAYALVGVLVPTAVKFAYDAAVRATTPGPSAGVRPSAGHGPMPQA
jgi:fucose 4-O-acetylase-like acetyltransferase